MIAFDARVTRGAFNARYRGSLGPLTVIGGPSGSGKTTLLDLIAGLIPAEGTCTLDGFALSALPPDRRGVGYAFQDDRLFPHLTVEKNLLFPRRTARFDEIVDRLELSALLPRRPKDLSGGEKRRVAIGRAFLAAERLLLLDEPLAPLDAKLRERASALIQDAAKTVLVILVSHEPFDATAVAIADLMDPPLSPDTASAPPDRAP